MAVAIPMPIRPGPTTPTVWLSIFCSSMLVPRIHAFCLGLVRLESCLKKRRQLLCGHARQTQTLERPARHPEIFIKDGTHQGQYACLLYTSDAADDLLCVDLGGRRIIKKKTKKELRRTKTR